MTTRRTVHRISIAAASASLMAALWTAACGGGSSTPTSPTPTSPTTVTLSASGASPKQVNIAAGDKVRFVNNDSAPHAIFSNPYPTHDGCPPINEVGTLAPGQSRDSGALTKVGACGFHDHLNEGTITTFQGTINVGTSGPGAPPPSGYLLPR